jgi:hypothetical protein
MKRQAMMGDDNERPSTAGLDHRGRFWIEHFRKAWAAHDVDLLLEPLRADCMVFYPPMTEATDRSGLHAFFSQVYERMPDFLVEPVNWAQKDDDIFVEWKASATLDGQVVRWEGADRFRFDQEARIVQARAYWDPRELLEKIAGQQSAGS